MRVPRWVYVGGVLAVLGVAGYNAADRTMRGPEHTTPGQSLERRGASEIPAKRTRGKLAPGIDADAADRAVPAERREDEQVAKNIIKGAR